jgi:hypothetical protein
MELTGPVAGGAHGWPFAAPFADLAGLGYRQDEFFLEGSAARFGPSPGSELSWDGRWRVEPLGTAPYKTRILVVRPEDPARFNGTVVVFWNNVSAGYENIGGGDSPEVFAGGYAYAAVTTQRVGVHGTAVNPQGLAAWDPERYGSLSIPSDDYSFDIFTQAARVLGPDRGDDGLDPMGGLEVRRLIAAGASQSAARLASYVNAVQPMSKRFDAFLLTMYFGGGAPLEVGDAVMTVHAADHQGPRIPEGLHLLRDDLGTPVMVVNTECEASACYPVRQPDTDRYRYWEVAGASHVSLQGMESSAPRMERDFGFSIPIDDAMKRINRVSIAPVVDAALHHLNDWTQGGAAPPAQPRLEFSGDPPEIVRDDNGIAQGGIRLPAVEVPLAHNSALRQAPDVFSRLVGYHEAFPPHKVRALYGSRAEYVARYEAATRAAEAASVILPRDVAAVVREGTTDLPL